MESNSTGETPTQAASRIGPTTLSEVLHEVRTGDQEREGRETKFEQARDGPRNGGIDTVLTGKPQEDGALTLDALSASESTVGEVLESRPFLEYQRQAQKLFTLGASAYERFGRLGEVSDLNKAIESQSQAISLTPDGHPDKPGYLIKLGVSYQARFERLGEDFDIQSAESCFRRASQSTTGPPSVRFSACQKLARLSLHDSSLSPLIAYQQAMHLIPHLVGAGAITGHRYELVTEVINFATEAASYATSTGSHELAYEWQEAGRAVVWGQITQLRTPFDHLSNHDPELAEALATVGRQLERAGSQLSPTLLPETAQPDMMQEADAHIRLALSWDMLLNKARSIPGFEDFLRPSTAGRLVDAPVAYIGPLIDSLISVFTAVERARINRAQWRLLQRRCVMVARLVGSQVTLYDRNNTPDLEGAANSLKDTFNTISARARHYNKMEQATEFLQFKAMSEEIGHMFSTLDSCLNQFSFTTDAAQSQWFNEFCAVQGQELATLADMREKIERIKNNKAGQAGGASKRAEILRCKGMSAKEMFECLKRHGCQDLTERLNMETILSHAVATGAYGDIFKGTLDDDTDIAVKVWSFRRADEAPHKSLKGAMRELYNWSKADHDNVQKLLGVVMFKDRLGMVSKWMGNGNLHDYIRKHQPEDRYQLCMQVAKAIQYLHKKQMVHGDLKAQMAKCNFLVSSDGTVKLTDFDHSIISCHSIVFSQTTTMGGGTMRWMAPELVMDEGEVELRSTQADIYALGMTLLTEKEIITGTIPYPECQSDHQVFYKLLEKILPEQTEHFHDEKGRQLWKLLKQCWDHEPLLRPSADQVVDVLSSLVLGMAPPGDNT